MKHIPVRMLTAYTQGTLPPAQHHACEQHLAHCPLCQRDLALLTELDAAWHNPAEALPPGFTEHITAQLPAQAKPPRPVRRRHVLLAGAAAFLFLQSGLADSLLHTDSYLTKAIQHMTHWMEERQ